MGVETMLQGKGDAIRQVCREHSVERLELFGSGADGSFDPERSDLDFLVVFAPCTPGEHYARYFGLLESLESLLRRPVDLVEATAMRNPYFIRSVEEGKRLLYAA